MWKESINFHAIADIVFLFLLFFRPLHVAASRGLVTVVQDLITRGASLLAVDNKGVYGDGVDWKINSIEF